MQYTIEQLDEILRDIKEAYLAQIKLWGRLQRVRDAMVPQQKAPAREVSTNGAVKRVEYAQEITTPVLAEACGIPQWLFDSEPSESGDNADALSVRNRTPETTAIRNSEYVAVLKDLYQPVFVWARRSEGRGYLAHRAGDLVSRSGKHVNGLSYETMEDAEEDAQRVANILQTALDANLHAWFSGKGHDPSATHVALRENNLHVYMYSGLRARDTRRRKCEKLLEGCDNVHHAEIAMKKWGTVLTHIVGYWATEFFSNKK